MIKPLANSAFTCFIIIISYTTSVGKDFNIKDFGAKTDGKTLNTHIIQEAIDSAENNFGSRVVIPKGTYVTGSIILKSGVTLHLTKGAKLLGSANPQDYTYLSNTTATYHWCALILAKDATKISISGPGTIDGNGSLLALNIDSLFYIGQLDSQLYQLKEKRPVAHARPQIIQFVQCKEINLQNVTIQNAASWVQTYDLCTNVKIDNIKVKSVSYWNNDGIDIIDCNKVSITNSHFNSSDDGICLKSYKRNYSLRPMCDSIYIANCTVRSSASAVKLGTSSFGGFTNIVIENIKVYDTYRSAIALESWETGILENILIQNIKAVNTGNALFIRLGLRSKYSHLRKGSLKNVVIKNIKTTVPYTQPDYHYPLRGPALPFFHNIFPISITGIPESKVQNIRIENISVTYPGRGDKSYAYAPISRLSNIPENRDDYPEFSMFGELPAWGVYIRHADGITIDNLKLKIKKPDYRPAIVCDDVTNLTIKNYKISGDKKKDLIIIYNSSNR